MIAVPVSASIVSVALLCAVPALADPLVYTADPGLRLRADSTTMIELPISDRWAVQSSVRQAAAVSPRDGLKLGLQGNYGWNVGNSHRVSLSAGLGLTDDPPPNLSVFDTTPARSPLASSFNQRKDFLLDFHWDWELTERLSLNSSLGLSHSIGPSSTDAINYGLPAAPGATSNGFVGLKLRF